MAGQRTISAAVLCLTRGKKLVRKAVDSVGVLYIFQLAAIRSLRMSFSIPSSKGACREVFHESDGQSDNVFARRYRSCGRVSTLQFDRQFLLLCQIDGQRPARGFHGFAIDRVTHH